MGFLKNIDLSLALAPSFFQKYVPWLETPLFILGNSPITTRTILQFVLIVFISYMIAALARKSLKHLSKNNKKFPD